jgi:hypothetical protein
MLSILTRYLQTISRQNLHPPSARLVLFCRVVPWLWRICIVLLPLAHLTLLFTCKFLCSHWHSMCHICFFITNVFGCLVSIIVLLSSLLGMTLHSTHSRDWWLCPRYLILLSKNLLRIKLDRGQISLLTSHCQKRLGGMVTLPLVLGANSLQIAERRRSRKILRLKQANCWSSNIFFL